jgi:hypothetical protein
MAFAQARAQIAVDLDDVQVIESREQRLRQCSEARTDFDDMIASPRIDGPDDALDNRRIDEKVLAEPLPRSVPARRHFSARAPAVPRSGPC